MMRYEPGTTVLHRLDPRTKLLFQAQFAVAAFAHTSPRGLAVLTGLTLVVLGVARISPLTAVIEFRFALPVLIAGPILAGLTLGPPWFAVEQAEFPTYASYRVLLLLLVSTAYVHTTPVRDSRAAIQWLVPGKPGQFLGMSVALVFRFVPVLLDDIQQAREAMQARLGTELSLATRIRLVATAGLRRADARADALSLALRARCFAWNPTLPALRLSVWDVPALALGVVVTAWALV